MKDPLKDATTLNEVFEKRVALSGNRVWLTLYSKNKVVCKLTFAGLLEGASAWAACLSKAGVNPGDRVLLVLPTEKAFYESFWGILITGAVPVPAYPPIQLGRMTEYLHNLAKLTENCGARIMITSRQIRPLVRPIAQTVSDGFRFIVPEDVAIGISFDIFSVSGSDLALLQYTSGSTGNQKGVMLSQENLLSNIRAIGHWLKFNSDDIAVSWLPLYHDMGLIGLMICTLYWDVPVVAMSPIDFLRDPSRWFRVISDHRGTLSAGPNFAYSLSARKVRPASIEGIDLSSWRLALCGGETIFPSTIERFTQRFKPYGFRPEAFFPAYGLAENTLAVTFSDLDSPPKLAYVDAKEFKVQGRAISITPGIGARAVVSVGKPIESVEVAVVDGDKRQLDEGLTGEVLVRGPSVMKGYLGNPRETAKTMENGWLCTGDVGFILHGYLYIAGRKKDMIIKAGRNYFAEDIEEAGSTVKGVRPGGLCALAIENPDRGTEDMVLIAEVSKGADKERLGGNLKTEVFESTGCRPDRVVLVAPRSLPKTSSGKLRRFKTQAMYLQGTIHSRGDSGSKTSGLWTYLKAWLLDKLKGITQKTAGRN